MTTAEATSTSLARLDHAVGGLDPDSAVRLRATFEAMFSQADEWIQRAGAIQIVREDQTREMKLARESRLALRELRINVERERKRLKEDSLRQGKAIDGLANVFKALVEPIEEHLLLQEKFAERAAQARTDALRSAREEALRGHGADPDAFADLGAMAEESWLTVLTTARLASEARAEEARKAEAARVEAARVAAERAEAARAEAARLEAERAERERVQREENARLRREASEREEAAKAERAGAEKARLAEQARAACELVRVETARRAERAEAEAKAAKLAREAEGERRARAQAEAELAEARAAAQRKVQPEAPRAEAARTTGCVLCDHVIAEMSPEWAFAYGVVVGRSMVDARARPLNADVCAGHRSDAIVAHMHLARFLGAKRVANDGEAGT